VRILYYERVDCERKKRKLQRVCCRLYPFILFDNKKEGPDNFSSGHIPYWDNHIYLCLYCIVYLLYFISTFFFILLLNDLVFITTGIRAKGNSQEKRVLGLSGRNGGRWKV
jgi:hypothetical protein